MEIAFTVNNIGTELESAQKYLPPDQSAKELPSLNMNASEATTLVGLKWTELTILIGLVQGPRLPNFQVATGSIWTSRTCWHNTTSVHEQRVEETTLFDTCPLEERVKTEQSTVDTWLNANDVRPSPRIASCSSPFAVDNKRLLSSKPLLFISESVFYKGNSKRGQETKTAETMNLHASLLDDSGNVMVPCATCERHNECKMIKVRRAERRETQLRIQCSVSCSGRPSQQSQRAQSQSVFVVTKWSSMLPRRHSAILPLSSPWLQAKNNG